MTNCHAVNCTVSGNNCVGIFVGELDNPASTIKACTATGGSVSGNSQVGAIVGYSEGMTTNLHKIVGCVGRVTGGANVVGNNRNTSAEIIASYGVNAYTITAGTGVTITYSAVSNNYSDVIHPPYINAGETVPVTLSYTGSLSNVTFLATGATLNDACTELYNAQGNVTINATGVQKTDISGGSIADISVQTWTGSAITPAPVVTVGGKTLTALTDYLVSYTNNTHLGTATVTVTGIGAYTGTLSKTFEIQHADIPYNSTGNYYEIGSETALRALSSYNETDYCSGKRFVQTADIAMTDGNFTPIGVRCIFRGTYDGGNHIISGLTVSGDYEHAGLFCNLERGTVENVRLVNPSISSTASGAVYVGALIGAMTEEATVSNCCIINPTLSAVTGGTKYIGIIVGSSAGKKDRVSDCYYYYSSTEDAPDPVGGRFNYDEWYSGYYSVTRVYKITATGCTATATATVTVGTTSYYNSGTAVTLPAAPAGWIYAYTVNGSPIDGNTFTMPTNDVTVTATFHVSPLLGWTETYNPDGTTKPYIISSAEGWGVFCDCLDDNTTWNRFIGKTVKLGNSIEVTRMAGGSYHDFCGTFDGQGHTLTFNYGKANDVSTESYVAPFRNAENCIIENLHVAGDIYTSGQFAAGIICSQYGTVTIRNCRSSINIHSSHSGDGTHGGLVANNNSSATLTIEGCVFDGSLLGTTTHSVGGFIGWRKGPANIYNSLFAPAAVTVQNEGSATFGRNDVDTHNCYYTYYLCDGEHYVPHYDTDGITRRNGHAPLAVTAGEDVTISAISPVGSPTSSDGYNGVYSVSGITAYAKGITRTVNETTTFYYGQGDDVSLTLSNTAGEAPLGYQHAYAASAGTLSGTTLTMPAEDVTISNALAPIDWANESTGLDWDHAYMIYNKDQLDLLAQRVNSGTTYENKYFKLGADITYSHTTDWNDATSTENNYTAIGKDDAAFSGHFDGQGHTVSGIRIYNAANTCQGLFGVLYFESGTAEIKNVILADARITGYHNTAGIMGVNRGTVSNCHVLSNVNIHADYYETNSHGGIAGNTIIGYTITACTSAASITSAAGSGCQNYGGIVGWNYGTVRDCLYLGNTVEGNSSVGAIIGYNFGGTVTNCYFTDTAIRGKNHNGNTLDNANSAVGSSGGTGLAPQDNTDNSNFLALMAARNTALTAVDRTTPLSTAVDITLSGRTLYKDGAWNTLCLPFGVADGDATDELTFSGTPLEGAIVKVLDVDGYYDGNTRYDAPAEGRKQTGLDGNTLNLYFKSATAIEAGKPYIVKWPKADGYDSADPDTRDLKNPVFTSVTINATASTEVSFTGGKFKGIYAPIEWDTENQSILFLGVKGGKSALYYPQPDGGNNPHLNAFRAYFQIGDGTSAAPQLTAINLNFDGETTGVTPLLSPEGEEGASPWGGLVGVWYTLSGTRLDSMPTAKGVYIHGGRKVVIK